MVSDLEASLIDCASLAQERDDAAMALSKANSTVKTMRHQLEVLLLSQMLSFVVR